MLLFVLGFRSDHTTSGRRILSRTEIKIYNTAPGLPDDDDDDDPASSHSHLSLTSDQTHLPLGALEVSSGAPDPWPEDSAEYPPRPEDDDEEEEPK